MKVLVLILSAIVTVQAQAKVGEAELPTDVIKHETVAAYDVPVITRCGYFLLRNEKNLDPGRTWTRLEEQTFTDNCVSQIEQFGWRVGAAGVLSDQEKVMDFNRCKGRVAELSGADRLAELEKCLNEVGSRRQFGESKPRGQPERVHSAEVEGTASGT